MPATFCARSRTIRSWLSASYEIVAGDVRLLEPADPVLEPGRARDRPRAGERLGVAQVRLERLVAGLGEGRRYVGQVGDTSGISHGSEPFARYASERRYTGVRYLSAIRTASIAASKHCDGLDAATTGTGLSPFRPNSTISRSACSGFVGIPVDGPARWMSRIRSGARARSRGRRSAFSTTPGRPRR